MNKKRQFGEAAFKPEQHLQPQSHSEQSKAAATATSRSLFHYTNTDGLIGIIEGRNLRATHYRFMNDYSEGQSILTLLLPKLEAELRELVPKLVKLGVLDPKALTAYGGEIHKRQAESMLRAITTATDNVAPFFMTSFCIHDPLEQHYERGLLSQWRGYARGGFAIEFDELKIDELNKKESAAHRFQGILTERVTYRNHSERVSDEVFEGFAGTMLKNSFPNLTDKLEAVLGKKVTEDFAHPFLSLGPFLKNESFEEENEYRIVALCNRPSKVEEGDKRPPKPVEFRSRPDGALVPYISLYKDLDAPLPIKGIIVGPHPRNNDRRMALEILLEKAGLDIPVRFSDIPYRD